MDKKIKIINAPSNLGYSNAYTGTFPEYLKISGLGQMLDTIGVNYELVGSVGEIEIDKSKINPKDKCKLADEVVEFNTELYRKVSSSIKTNNDFQLVIGGDHSLGIGSIFGQLSKRSDLAVIWLDAHPDIHTPKTTMTGWVYGMPSAVVLGHGDKRLLGINKSKNFVEGKNFHIFGAQFIDPPEAVNIKKFGVDLTSLDDILHDGIGKSLDKVVESISNCKFVHLSLDLDVIDHEYAPGTSEHSKGQLNYREIKYVCRKLGESGLVTSMDIVEGDPTKDIEGKTAKLSLELIANILGHTYSEYDAYLSENDVK